MLNDNIGYKHDQLFCEDVPLMALAETYGTPLYVYSAAQLRSNVQRLQAAFPNAQLHYSLKANANLSIIRFLHQLGIGMDAVSGGEIYKALQAGVNAEDIVFAGVGKTRDELQYALNQGVGFFNVENVQELDLLNMLANMIGVRPRVALRLNPQVQAKTHRYIATGHGKAKFGIAADALRDILHRQADFPHIDIEGVHIHIGSQLGNVSATQAAIENAQEMLAPYPALKTLNIGGGFPVPYTEQDDYPSVDEFAAGILPLVDGWHIKIEPGRSIAANAGLLLVETLYTKQQGEAPILITDGSMTELLRPALYEAEHPVYPVLKPKSGTEQSMVVAGPVCETADILHHNAPLPTQTTIGDLLAFTMAGAYGMVMASNYNQRPRPAEVLIDGHDVTLIRRRETWSDLLQFEQI